MNYIHVKELNLENQSVPPEQMLEYSRVNHMMLTTDASVSFPFTDIIFCASTSKHKNLQYTSHLTTREFEKCGAGLKVAGVKTNGDKGKSHA